ncbi:MAG: radical SAM protein [Gemmatimonadales bacterium]|nr:radical SAM protein [Gemmatimonadales bacterium]NIN13377.1 radical SAM protein [Gemmatimonadales bacterium]NIN51380.1 radical SAM protein [Gemmatimonadales bacterium]NIP08844.1 radical SAM protein [Gemmatimonadales bacterium]NIQ99838.1 radical SAM protein [Gemmatimonadales bacterium]
MSWMRALAPRVAPRYVWNLWRKNPLTVSFEVTHACTANCWHCNWGGRIKETRRTAEEYGAICRELKPLMVNLSGGEPMARGDLDEIISAVANPGRLPVVVVVTNASQLTPERFLRLKAAGMHQLSVSIDYPDDRHSEFRRIPGLFDRMAETVPQCRKLAGEGDVLLNCCVTTWNYRAVPDVVRLAKQWGVFLNFSCYTMLRTDDAAGSFRDADSARELKAVIQEVIDLKRAGMPVYTSERTLWKFYRFLVRGHMDGCKAGYRFLVVNPDGRLTPCAMVMAYFNDHRTMQREFSCTNTCGACYISTRANAEKTLRETIVDNLGFVRGFFNSH